MLEPGLPVPVLILKKVLFMAASTDQRAKQLYEFGPFRVDAERELLVRGSLALSQRNGHRWILAAQRIPWAPRRR